MLSRDDLHLIDDLMPEEIRETMREERMTLGIIGGGVVGKATASCFRDARIFDIDPSKSNHHLAEVLDSDLVFICLPTPQSYGANACDIGIVSSFFATVPKDKHYVIRSTLPVGATRIMARDYGLTSVCHWPEFLTARTAERDAQHPTRNVVGRCVGMAWQRLYDLISRRWPGVPFFPMSSDESEAVKILQNSFSAVKVSFFNEARSLCDFESMDWDKVLAALLAGGWINPMHTQVPGPDGQRGFGGACLPKDLANFVECLESRGLRADVGCAALARNEGDRGEPRSIDTGSSPEDACGTRIPPT